MRHFFLVLVLLFAAIPQFVLAKTPDYSGYSQKALKEMADAGDAHAMYSFGYNFAFDENERPKELSKDSDSLNYIRKADEGGHGDASSFLGLYYSGEFGGEADSDSAKAAFIRGADRGSIAAKMNFILRFEHSGNKDDAKRIDAYLLNMKDLADAQEIVLSRLASAYTIGSLTIQQDLEKGFNLAKSCVEILPDDSQCNYLLGRFYKEGWVGDKDIPLSSKHYIRAAEAGDMRAQWHAGIAYIQGLGVEVDKVEAYKWVELSAEQGYLNGLISYAVMNATGEGTERNYEAAFAAYEDAARLGSYHALRGLAGMYYNGEGVEQDQRMGTAALLVAHENGEENAKILLQMLYGDEWGKNDHDFKQPYKDLMLDVKNKYGFDK